MPTSHDGRNPPVALPPVAGSAGLQLANTGAEVVRPVPTAGRCPTLTRWMRDHTTDRSEVPPMPARPRLRTIPQPKPTILAATDLGSVEVAKHGNLYLLTDPRGDIRLDGRGLGLYELDTRVLSASMLRLNGSPLTLLRGPYLRDGVDTIQ